MQKVNCNEGNIKNAALPWAGDDRIWDDQMSCQGISSCSISKFTLLFTQNTGVEAQTSSPPIILPQS
jgi:hypothetical protein